MDTPKVETEADKPFDQGPELEYFTHPLTDFEPWSTICEFDVKESRLDGDQIVRLVALGVIAAIIITTIIVLGVIGVHVSHAETAGVRW